MTPKSLESRRSSRISTAATFLMITSLLSAGSATISPARADTSGDEYSSTPANTAPRVSSEIVDKGEYRLGGSAEFSLDPAEALAILTAFDQHCAEGCRWPILSLDHVEILEHDEKAGQIVTWTRIDDVMDASYFQRASHRQDGETVELVIETPEPAELERLESAERPHAPFFHSQRVTWRLSPTPEGTTRAEVEMEMASDRFLINLMPKRVLEGAETNLLELFAHLDAAQSSD